MAYPPAVIDEIRIEHFDHTTPAVHRRDADEDRPVRVSVVSDDRIYEVMVIEDADGETKLALREGSGWSEAIPLRVLAKALRPSAL